MFQAVFTYFISIIFSTDLLMTQCARYQYFKFTEEEIRLEQG